MPNFEELTKTLIQTQVLQALKDAPEYLDALVRAAMEQEVSEHGTKPEYHTRTKMPWLEWCVRDALRNAAKMAVLEIVREMQPQIKDSVKKCLSSDEIVAVFAKRIIDGTVDYKINVQVVAEKDD